jgi:hypothetical protein
MISLVLFFFLGLLAIDVVILPYRSIDRWLCIWTLEPRF